MKKTFLFLFSLIFLLAALVIPVIAREETMKLENISTLNFKAKMGYLRLFSIKKICSYDYCDYNRGNSFDETIEIFTRNYLKTIEDEELKATLRIKGIKITKLIFEN